jgi:hypothetical protein
MVRLHSSGVQRSRPILQCITAAEAAEEEAMRGMKFDRSLLSPEGELLVYAPPILIGFRGAPLELADAQPKRRTPRPARRNWAKRRAYGE